MNYEDRATHISGFLGLPYDRCFKRLKAGFPHNHALVAKDFLDKKVNVRDSASLLNWYRTSDAYIWELSAYHLDPGFNYSGMCEGISLGMKNTGRKEVLNLGDGVGDLSIRMEQDGLSPTYHDLEFSLTANFAQYVFEQEGYQIKTLFTNDWEPSLGDESYDAVVALDLFEHLINVEDWVHAVYKALRQNGAFLAQNAFACGDAEHGNSIPMHLSINNRFEKEWDGLLESVGFVRNPENDWWIKP